MSEDLQLACYLLANILDSWCEIEGNSILSVSYKSATREAISVSNEGPKMYLVESMIAALFTGYFSGPGDKKCSNFAA